MTHTPSRDEIERKAYEIYEQRGCEDGHAEEHWFAAERELTQQLAEAQTPKTSSRVRTAVTQAMQKPNARKNRN